MQMNLDQVSVAEIVETDAELDESGAGLITDRRKNFDSISK